MIRPVELRELDKQAHKMIIAYVLGKHEEDNPDFGWTKVIEGGLFEFLQRAVLTDLKPQVFHRIKADRQKYGELNKWVLNQLLHIITPLGEDFVERFKAYFAEPHEDINKRILSAAHFYATRWEFEIIERSNPNGYEIDAIKKNIQDIQEKYYDLRGLQNLLLYRGLRSFVDMCGQLRFQIRWANLYRIPKTSVLGHMLIVAILSYLFSIENGSCARRCYNNYFTGLFHDLPEVLTRDIVHPVKRSIHGLEEIIKEYEKEMMKEEVYNLIPSSWHPEMKMFTEYEFATVVTAEDETRETTTQQINDLYNTDQFSPRDGELVKAADNLAALIEAYLAISNGMKAEDFFKATKDLTKAYLNRFIGKTNIGEVFSDFS